MKSKKMDLKEFNRVLIIAPHPDDEIFGCAGLMRHSVTKNIEVYIIVTTRGEAVHRDCCNINEELLKKKREELCYLANKNLGIVKNNITFLTWSDSELERLTDDASVINEIRILIERINPDTIFCPHPLENTSDHVAIYSIVKSATIEFNGKLFYYCVWFWYHKKISDILKLDFNSSFLLDIKKEYIFKKDSINIYINNTAQCGNPYSGKLPFSLMYSVKWVNELFYLQR
ncbi:MAG: PIG-L family deacetylase [Mariniphaga sp.]